MVCAEEGLCNNLPSQLFSLAGQRTVQAKQGASRGALGRLLLEGSDYS